MIKPHLLIVVALSCEAKAIRQLGDWKRQDAVLKGCQVYARLDKPMTMIVSGAGKISSALATSWLAERFKEQCLAMINIGVAGKLDAQLGDLYWIHKIIEASTSKSWYPQSQAKHALLSCNLMTFDQAQTIYPKNALIDMEASGFIQAATKWVSIENIALIKCISDNKHSDISGLKPTNLFDLLVEKRDCIENILDSCLKRLARSLVSPEQAIDLSAWLSQWHFTVTQQHQLKDQLKALNILMPSNTINLKQFLDCKASKHVLANLRELRIKASGELYHE
jgi:nucleoside phosphorylase